MPKCYAYELGDCKGKLEEEHFIPDAIQKMIGPARLSGFAWQNSPSKLMLPGSYAKSRMLCSRHHDELDGLDANARDYFRNWMLIAFKNHIATGEVGRIQDIQAEIDGRGLERWFLKTICGAIVAGTFVDMRSVPSLWITALFGRTPWPEEWSLYVFTGTRVSQNEDAMIDIQFHWSPTHYLNGIVINAFAVQTMFSIQTPDTLPENALRRPKLLGAYVKRPDDSQVLAGLPARSNVEFRLSWSG